MENLLHQKVFTNKSISLATLFGGPVAAGFLISKNFKTFGNEKAAKTSIFIGIVSTLLLFAALFSLPENVVDNIPQALIPAIYTIIIGVIVEKLQGNNIKEFLENNGQKASGWTAAAYGLLGLVLNIALILILIFSVPQTGYEKQLKLGDNVSLYYSKNIKDNSPQRIGEIITKSGFLAESEGVDVFFSETANSYILKFVLPDKSLLEDNAIIEDFNGFEKYLNYNLNFKKKIEIKFTDVNLIEEYNLPETEEVELAGNIYEPIMYLDFYKVNENHTIYYNSEMPVEEVKILEKAVTTLKGYFPVNQVIDIIFLNNESNYVLKFFVNKEFWNNNGAINRIKSTAEYIKDSGISKEIVIVFVDNTDFSEKEI